MELWWLLVIVPLWSLWQALKEAWASLLSAADDIERKMVIERAAVKALMNSAAVAGMWFIPWPYKLLCFLPSLAPRAIEIVGDGITLFLSMKMKSR